MPFAPGRLAAGLELDAFSSSRRTFSGHVASCCTVLAACNLIYGINPVTTLQLQRSEPTRCKLALLPRSVPLHFKYLSLVVSIFLYCAPFCCLHVLRGNQSPQTLSSLLFLLLDVSYEQSTKIMPQKSCIRQLASVVCGRLQ